LSDRLEDDLAAFIGIERAQSVTCDALLLSFALNCPGVRFKFGRLDERQVTADEYLLVALTSLSASATSAEAEDLIGLLRLPIGGPVLSLTSDIHKALAPELADANLTAGPLFNILKSHRQRVDGVEGIRMADPSFTFRAG
jgi:hypothetical protein